MNNKKIDWKWWWKQVLNGTIPQSVYRQAKMKDYYQRKIQELTVKKSGK